MKNCIVVAALGLMAVACTKKVVVPPHYIGGSDGGVESECAPEGSRRVASPRPQIGICRNEIQVCVGGVWTVQIPATNPRAETCNNLDDNCDGVADDGFDRAHDEVNCGACGHVCSFAHASATCNNGVCELDECAPGRYNVDADDANGCEAVCVPRGVEICDAGGEDGAVDEDCDGLVNEGCECDEGTTQACGPAGVPLDVFDDPTSRCKLGFQACMGGAFDEVCIGFVGPVAESCNGIDDDCDGVVDNGFAVGVACDGIGGCGAGTNECSRDGTRTICSTDPGGSASEAVAESCNGIDDDCDGAIDDGYPIGVRCRGQGICSALGEYECAPDGRDVICSTEPGGTEDRSESELCDGRDHDCNGTIDDPAVGCDCEDGDLQPCGLADRRMDGVGICRQGLQLCADGIWMPCAGARTPDAVELCNGADDDCDGLTDEDIDRDALGRLRSVGDACEGTGECGGGIVQCADESSTICSSEPGGRDFRIGGAVGVESCDELDNDCDGETDEGYGVGAFCRGFGACARTIGTWECNATHDDVVCSTGDGGSDFRGSAETCDAVFVDEDCDGASNEGCTCANGATRVCGSSNVGQCRLGTQTCAGGAWGACVGNVEPVVETCNGQDDDCDGATDEDFGVGVICDGVGECPIGVVECWGPNESGCSTDIRGSRYPDYTEVCNGLDDDCDGFTDEGYFIGAPCDGTGSCGFGFYECAGPRSIICSTNPGGSDDQSVPESCLVRGIDDDCDGSVDEGCPCTGSEQRACGSSNMGQCRFGIQTCVAAPPGVSPDRQWGACVGAVEPSGETCNGLDDDCDGAVDDGFGVGGPCVAPGACGGGRNECNGPAAVRCDVAPGGSRDRSRAELCNGADDDCDGQTDEPFGVGFSCDGVGQCGGGRTECADLDSVRCSTDRGGSGDQSMPESCVGLADESCDGTVNEGCACTYFGPGDPRNNIQCGVSNFGLCRFGTQSCRPDGSYGACVGAVSPSPEVCNGQDDDCDGAADEGLVCVGGPGCVPNPEVCNGVDDDCDGMVDEGGVCGGPMCVAELCNGADDDCDGLVDEGSNICNLRNVDIAACRMAACDIVQCTPNFWDCNGVDADGCEYACIPQGPERCGNGVDDDCNCSIDQAPCI